MNCKNLQPRELAGAVFLPITSFSYKLYSLFRESFVTNSEDLQVETNIDLRVHLRHALTSLSASKREKFLMRRKLFYVFCSF